MAKNINQLFYTNKGFTSNFSTSCTTFNKIFRDVNAVKTCSDCCTYKVAFHVSTYTYILNLHQITLQDDIKFPVEEEKVLVYNTYTHITFYEKIYNFVLVLHVQ